MVVPCVVLALNYVLSEVSDYDSRPVFILQDRGQNLIGGCSICKSEKGEWKSKMSDTNVFQRMLLSWFLASDETYILRGNLLYCKSIVIQHFSNSSDSCRVEVVNFDGTNLFHSLQTLTLIYGKKKGSESTSSQYEKSTYSTLFINTFW